MTQHLLSLLWYLENTFTPLISEETLTELGNKLMLKIQPNGCFADYLAVSKERGTVQTLPKRRKVNKT